MRPFLSTRANRLLYCVELKITNKKQKYHLEVSVTCGFHSLILCFLQQIFFWRFMRYRLTSFDGHRHRRRGNENTGDE